MLLLLFFQGGKYIIHIIIYTHVLVQLASTALDPFHCILKGALLG